VTTIAEFAREELGVELTDGQRRAVDEFEAGGHEQAIWRWGRRSGKSLVADVIAVHDAVVRDHLRRHLRPGEPRIAGIVCPRLDQAAAHVASIAAMVGRSPRLRKLLAGEPTSEEVAFVNGSVVKAFPCSARGIRGGAWSCAVLDELGHFVTTADGNAASDAVLEAVVPSLAQFGTEGRLVAISTPRWRQGAFATLVARAEGGRFGYMHAVHASTSQMNPAISARWLEERRREDPEVYAREYLAEFVDGVSSYLPSAEVVAAVRHGVGNLAPVDGVRYAAALDPAYSHDAFAMAVAHLDEDGRVVVDAVHSWRRAGHEATCDAVAEVARAYGLARLASDQHCIRPVQEGLARRGVKVDYRPWSNASKAEAFGAVKVRLNTGGVELPDHAGLVEELCGLEARPTPSGLTRIAAAGAGHDDLAVAVAAVVAQLAPARRGVDPAAVLAGLAWRGDEPRRSPFGRVGGPTWDRMGEPERGDGHVRPLVVDPHRLGG